MTLESFAIMNIAIMCWSFCSVYVFIGMSDDDDTPLGSLGKLITAIIIGWLIAPIRLAIELNDFFNKDDE